MNKTPSPYFIETVSGKLELTKGLFLALQKKKSSTLKTVKKRKQISHIEDQKRTVGKGMRESFGRRMIQSVGGKEISFKTTNKNHMTFSVGRDCDYLNTCMDIPSIEMVEDNDDETSWNQVEESIKNMSLSLSISAFDRMYGRV